MSVNGFDEVVGHHRPVKVLRRALSSGRIAHAYLFWGPGGIGKELVAMKMAEALLCSHPDALANGSACGECPSCVKCRAGGHPDLHLVATSEKSISVKNIRELQQTLAYRAFERGRKVVIIRDAFRITREGVNAILKTVEDPPEGTHLIFLSIHRSQLLDTLVSRCQTLRFDQLESGDVMRILTEKGMEGSEARRMADFSGGSIGVALSFDVEAATEVEEETHQLCHELERMSAVKRFELAERWSKDKEGLHLRLQCLERHLMKMAVSQDWALEIADRIERVRNWIDRNANIQLALDALFLGSTEGAWKRMEDR
jgi:DNA polymerase-3 subunit delta'